MKNLKKINRHQLKSIVGGAQSRPDNPRCMMECCPPPGVEKCPQLCCLVACPTVSQIGHA